MEAAREGGLHCVTYAGGSRKGKRKGKKEASLVVDNRGCISEIGIEKGKSYDLPYIFCTLCVSAVCNPLKLSRVRGHDTQLQRMRYPP